MSVLKFTIFGNKYRMGSYLLMFRISSPFQLAFGRFQQGKLFTITEGDYLYIGSALGRSGSPLARRLIRHASRSGEKIPQEIRSDMINLFPEYGLSGSDLIEPSIKALRWHIDYLLDRPEAEITHVVVIRSGLRLEKKLSELLEPLDETSPLAPRLGAGDMQHGTHILRLTDRNRILDLLVQHLPAIITE